VERSASERSGLLQHIRWARERQWKKDVLLPTLRPRSRPINLLILRSLCSRGAPTISFFYLD
jgi:hypothetical protein